jgi:GNAT superfamily N-acetyltransferase
VNRAIRRMRVEDIAASFALRVATRENRVTLEEMRDVYGVTAESTAAAMAGSVAGWVCEEDGRLLGFAMGDAATGEVSVVALRPEAEGQGIGGALLRRVQEHLFAAGHSRLWLLASPDPAVRASGFYAHLGWRPTGEVRGDDVVLELAAQPISASRQRTTSA